MARIKPTITLRNERAGRNKRNRPVPSAPKSKAAPSRHVDWGRVRLWGVGVAFACLWVLLWARTYQVQVILGPRYLEEARRAQITTEVATGRRGSILDRNGNALAKSVEAKSVAVRPRQIQNPDHATRVLAAALGQSPVAVRKLITGKRPFAWVARKVSPQAAEAIAKANLPGIQLVREYERVYPFRHLAGQIVGFADVDERGIEGLEKAFNESLSGQQKRRVMQRDAVGRRLYSGTDDAPEDLTGDDLVLTLDTQVQFFAESALLEGVEVYGARWAGCMVVDVPSGDILAWAEYPFFNPNTPGAASPFVRRNKTAMDALEQGSTIKPFLMAAALEEKIITPGSTYACEKGKWKLRNVTIRDTSPHDTLSAREILKVSSNIGVAKIGLALGTQKYHSYLTRLGFGQKTGLPLAGEHRGIVHPARQWSEIDLASASFGQSFSATIIQMAQAYLCLANDGIKKPLRLVRSEEKQPEEGERIFSTEVMREVRGMLQSAVEDTGGTGRRARIGGLVVGGKTGTAQKASGDSYGAGRVASFVGLLPVEEPRYLVLVVFDEPVKNQYGGVVAAPVFRDVALKTMAYHGLLPEGTPAQALAELARKQAGGPAVPAPDDAAAAAAAAVAAVRDKQGSILPRTELRNMAQAGEMGGDVPSVLGLSVRKAVEAFARKGLVPSLQGEGVVVVRQLPEPGSAVTPGSAAQCTLWLGEKL